MKSAQAELIVDATLGDGGYALAILQAMPPTGRVIGIDRDREAIERAERRLASFGSRFKALRGNFRDLEKLLHSVGVDKVDGVVADLGLSTLQISDPARGFTFSQSGPLLMIMGDDADRTAEDVVNEYDESELARIIRTYGEERAAGRIARAIAARRREKRITTTDDLADIVRSVVGGRYAIKSLARVFQAIRIHINAELENLSAFLPQALEVLKPGGRMAVVSYHSLEDRMVKQFMQVEQNPCICPPELPMCVCGRKPRLMMIGKIIRPTPEEVNLNPSSRSAKLRIAEKV